MNPRAEDTVQTLLHHRVRHPSRLFQWRAYTAYIVGFWSSAVHRGQICHSMCLAGESPCEAVKSWANKARDVIHGMSGVLVAGIAR